MQQFEGHEVRNVMEMLANLKLNIGEEDSLRTSVDEKVTASDVEQWFDVENDGDVRDAIVSDIVSDDWNSCTRGRRESSEVNEETASPLSLA